jgi:hypothetical protein
VKAWLLEFCWLWAFSGSLAWKNEAISKRHRWCKM